MKDTVPYYEDDLVRTCECGCGTPVARRFVSGHNRRGAVTSPEHRAALADGQRRAWATTRKRKPLGSRRKDSNGYWLVKWRGGTSVAEKYYEDDLVTLYHGDCREVTAWLEADVLVTDPPYGTQLHSSKNSNPGGYGRGTRAERRAGHKMIAGDLTTEARDAALRAWANRGPTLVFGSPRMPDPPGEWADRLVWDKKRPGINGGPWRYRHESIFVTAGFIRTDNAAVSIIEAFPEQDDHIHGKPLALMLRLVAAAPHGVIADPFAGSGSTLTAAKQLGRMSIGVEVDERYCEIAARRLAQDTLFGGVA